MKLDEETSLLLEEYGEFDENGVLISIEDITLQLVEGLDAEFISLIHDEMVDRRDIYNRANPKQWYDRCTYNSISGVKEITKEYIRQNPILQKNDLYKKMAADTLKFWDENVQSDAETELMEFEDFIRRNRHEYIEDKEYDVYGIIPKKEFYIDLLCGNLEIIAGNRTITCRTMKKNGEVVFLRDEKDNEILFNVENVKGKGIEWTRNGKVLYSAELEPLYKSMYNVYTKHTDGITDAALATSDKLFTLYRKITVGDANKEKIDDKNVKDYISRINKILLEHGISKELRISKEGSIRFIPYLKYKYSLSK